MWFPRVLVCEPGRSVAPQLLNGKSPPRWVLQHVTTLEELLARVRMGPAGVQVIDWKSVQPHELEALTIGPGLFLPEPSIVLLPEDDSDPGPAWELGATAVLNRRWSPAQLVNLVDDWMDRLIQRRGRESSWR